MYTLLGDQLNSATRPSKAESILVAGSLEDAFATKTLCVSITRLLR